MKENWTYKKLGEACEIYQPQTISTEMLVPDGEYLVYGANGIIGRYDKYNHIESEVLLTCRGATCGSINVSAPYSWINGNAMVIHPIDDSVFCSRSFLVYLMKSIDYSLVITGAAQPQITRQKLSPVKIAIPPIETQSRIVSELDLLQSIIDKQKAQLKKLDNLAQAVFYDMFGDPVENEKGWEVKTIGELVDKSKNSLKRGPFGGALKKEIFVNDGFLVYEQYHALNNDFTFGRYFITEDKYHQMKEFKVEPDDILISCSGVNLGKLAIVPSGAKQGIMNQALLKLRLDQNIMTNIMFVYIFSNENFKKKYFGDYRGCAIPNFPPMTEFKKFSFPVPPLSLQQSFAAKIESIEKQKTAITQSIAETQRLFDYTMDKYFG